MQHEILSGRTDSRPLFEMLKQGTTDLQRKMQILSPLMESDLSISDYRHFLFRMLGFFIPAEEQINEFLSHGRDPFDMRSRSKVPLLIGDLKALGMPFDEIQHVPVCGAIKEINSSAALVGTLYALEVLTLDSQIVYKKLKEKLNLAENQLQFYHGYGRETYEMWFTFRAVAESLVSEKEKEQAVSQARNIFIKLKNWLKMTEF